MAKPPEKPETSNEDEPVKSSPLKILIPIALLGLLAGGGYWYTSRDPGPTPAELINKALDLLEDTEDPHAYQRARRIAKKLKDEDYDIYEYPWAIEYIMGLAAFYDAEADSQYGQSQLYVQAEKNLTEAIKHGLDVDSKPEFAHAMGTILYRVGAAEKARDYLLQIVQKKQSQTDNAPWTPKQIDALSMLIESYDQIDDSYMLSQALEYSKSLVKIDSLSQAQRDRAYLQLAHLYQRVGQTSKADEAAAKVSANADSQAIKLFKAQALMGEGRLEEAKIKLAEIESNQGLDRTNSQQASYLLGVCEEQLNRVDEAIRHYQKTARAYIESPEAVAADLHAAELLRLLGRDEQALRSYERALKAVEDPKTFRNRWVNAERFRGKILNAWSDWLEDKKFDESIQLTALMPPLFSLAQSVELSARSKERWAEYVEQEYQVATQTRRLQLEPIVLEHWRRSAREYAQLADHIIVSSQYPDVLWKSATQFRQGHDFDNALIQIDKYIKTQPEKRLAIALVRRGEILMDLGNNLQRIKEAISDFETVVEDYPTDPAAFEAQYRIGECYLELDEINKAEKAWRVLIDSPALRPKATEWRLSLFSLGRLLCHSAELMKRNADTARLQGGGDAEELAELEAQAYVRWDEAIQLLDIYLARYPDSDEAVEARYLLAKTLQDSAGEPIQRLKVAETENARNELQNTINELLNRSADQYVELLEDLKPKGKADHLNTFGQHVLRDSYFEIANIYYSIGRFEDAIKAYSQAVTHYPQDPQVLLAYLQMTECYDRLGKPVEARSMIERAKLIHKNLDEALFNPEQTNLTKEEWGTWIERARQLRVASGT